MLILLLIVLLLTICYFKIRKAYDYWTVRGIKHLKPTFLFGNTAGSSFGRESVYQELMTLYKAFPNERYIGMYSFTTPILIIKDLDLIKSVVVKDFDHFVDHREFVPSDSDPIWSKNLFALQGSKWKHMRSTLSPAFTSSKMRVIFALITETIGTYMDYLNDMKIHQIEIKDFFTRFTNDAIASIAFGIKCDSINDRQCQFYANARRITSIRFRELLMFNMYAQFPKLSQKLSLSISPRDVRNFLFDVIKETIKVREEQGTFRPDMISLLIEEKKQREARSDEKLSNDEIIAQAFIFLFAGLDTVSSALVFCAYELSRNLEIQQKLQKEIDEVLIENRTLSYEALSQMKYMDQVVSETLRLWPPAVGGDRMCTKTYVIEPINPTEQKVILNPGDLIWVPLNALQKDPKYFPNPDLFDPERFNDENKAKIKPYTYMPFGNGPRICIGNRLALMEVKAFLFHLLQKYTIIATSSEPAKISTVTFDLRLDGDIYVQLTPRMK